MTAFRPGLGDLAAVDARDAGALVVWTVSMTRVASAFERWKMPSSTWTTNSMGVKSSLCMTRLCRRGLGPLEDERAFRALAAPSGRLGGAGSFLSLPAIGAAFWSYGRGGEGKDVPGFPPVPRALRTGSGNDHPLIRRHLGEPVSDGVPDHVPDGRPGEVGIGGQGAGNPARDR